MDGRSGVQHRVWAPSWRPAPTHAYTSMGILEGMKDRGLHSKGPGPLVEAGLEPVPVWNHPPHRSVWGWDKALSVSLDRASSAGNRKPMPFTSRRWMPGVWKNTYWLSAKATWHGPERLLPSRGLARSVVGLFVRVRQQSKPLVGGHRAEGCVDKPVGDRAHPLRQV